MNHTLKFKYWKDGRGFSHIDFRDAYELPCTIQKSSLATADAIWFGITDASPKILGPDGWVPYPIPEAVLLRTTMHLTRDQVAQLLSLLQHFVSCGEIPTSKELAKLRKDSKKGKNP